MKCRFEVRGPANNHSLPDASCLTVDLTVNPFGATSKKKSIARETLNISLTMKSRYEVNNPADNHSLPTAGGLTVDLTVNPFGAMVRKKTRQQRL